MSTKSRSKGARGEREFLKKLGADLGIPLDRNLDQVRDGGLDSHSLPGFIIEIKRAEALKFNSWWALLIEQSAAYPEDIPILAFRKNSEPWKIAVPLFSLREDHESVDDPVILQYDTFLKVHCDLVPRVPANV